MPEAVPDAPNGADALYAFHVGDADAPEIDVFLDRPGEVIPAALFGKFCEHLGENIYGGMDAQLLFNPTFGRWRFGVGECWVNGGERGESDAARILARVHADAEHRGVDPDCAQASWKAALAFGWLRVGDEHDVRFSPDVAFAGNRAQRMEILRAGADAGMEQVVWFPLHRVRRYRWRVSIRAEAAFGRGALRMTCRAGEGTDAVVDVARLTPGDEWTCFEGEVDLPAAWPEDRPVRVRLTGDAPGNWVVREIAWTPADAVDGLFDPEIVALLRASKLPLLRWPGGNFVSGYRWRDGVGPVDRRPTKPNPAWEGLEYHRFGTAEFIRFCRAVGCEPMICVNAGDGDPEEAAAWVEYCNGGPDTEGGRLRAAHGYPDPFDVRRWEIGNELWGRWQVQWTTPGGNADRFVRFARAMRRVDADIDLLATGPQCLHNQEWTRTLLDRGGPEARVLTDHVLSGGDVTPADDPWEIFQAYTGYARDAGREYRWTRDEMARRGIDGAGLALTEMQIFPFWKDAAPVDAPEKDAKPTAARMTRDELVHPGTLAEACHFVAYLCEAVRLDGFMQLITHSATVNHGGGLSKWHARVWAHPVHDVMAMLTDLHQARRVGLAVRAGVYATEKSIGFIGPMADVPEIDAVAGRRADGRVVVAVTSRARATRRLTLRPHGSATVVVSEACLLAGDAPWSQNSIDAPRRVAPRPLDVAVDDGAVTFALPPSAVAVLVL